MANDLEGYAELTKKLRELADPKQQAAALRESVRKPMNDVKKVAQANIAKISPGKTELHRTYKGRLVSAGFASRSLKVVVKLSKDKQSATALLGVKKEAFYALQFHELGTAYIPKNPWLVPAFESQKDPAVQKIGETLKKRIERIAKMRAAGGGRGRPNVSGSGRRA